jgi:mannosidase alpha-like ER degradation enhancer 2
MCYPQYTTYSHTIFLLLFLLLLSLPHPIPPSTPQAELKPLTCDGAPFDPIKIPLVTLIDTLDTLVILGNHSEFRRAVGLVGEHYRGAAFDIDVNVSVFETTIRILGGLLSAHLMAIDPALGIYVSK